MSLLYKIYDQSIFASVITEGSLAGTLAIFVRILPDQDDCDAADAATIGNRINQLIRLLESKGHNPQAYRHVYISRSSRRDDLTSDQVEDLHQAIKARSLLTVVFEVTGEHCYGGLARFPYLVVKPRDLAKCVQSFGWEIILESSAYNHDVKRLEEILSSRGRLRFANCFIEDDRFDFCAKHPGWRLSMPIDGDWSPTIHTIASLTEGNGNGC